MSRMIRERGRRTSVLAAAALLMSPAVCEEAVSAPIKVYDKKYPGYYQPFNCLRYEPDSKTHGFLRNTCSYAVEAHVANATGMWGTWTIQAGKHYPIFDGISGPMYACMPNDNADKNKGLCKEWGAKTPEQSRAQESRDAANLRKDLGLGTGSGSTSSGGGGLGQETEAQRLARELGVDRASYERSVAPENLAESFEQWDREQAAELREKERRELVRREQARAAAAEQARIDAARRAEAARLDQLEAVRRERERQEQVLASQRESNEAEESQGWLAAIGAAAFEIAAGRAASRSGSARAPSQGYGGEACRHDPAVIGAIQTCFDQGNRTATEGICGYSRRMAACYGNAAARIAHCPSAAAQARDFQQQFESEAAAACER